MVAAQCSRITAAFSCASCTRPQRHGQGRAVPCAAQQSIADKTTDFFKTLRSTLTPPKDTNFEPEALIKELTDASQFGKRGEAYFAAQLALVFLTIFPLIDLHILEQLVGAGGVALGLAIIVAGSNALGRNLTPLPAPREGAALVTNGMFAYMRHPLYTGLMSTTWGLAALTQDGNRALFAFALTVLLTFKASYEERQLIAKFGADYEKYLAEVKRFGLF